MKKSIKVNLEELVEAGIIDEALAAKIVEFEASRQVPSVNRLLTVFGVLGAVLVGSGLILIVAHNWDHFSRLTKTVYSFLPMIAGQAICVYVLLRKMDSPAWREGSAAFLFFAVGACISLIDQVYHLDTASLGEFLLVWLLLTLPVVYAMNSSVVSLLYIAGATWYGVECGYGSHGDYLYWGLLALSFPYFYLLLRREPDGNAFNFHTWFYGISLVICLGTLEKQHSETIWFAYATLFSAFFLLGESAFFQRKKWINNPFRILGVLGTLSIFIPLSFDWFWEGWRLQENATILDIFNSPATWFNVLLLTGAFWLWNRKNISPFLFSFLVILMALVLGKNQPLAGIVLTNIFLLATGIYYIVLGNRHNHLGLLNFGLMVLTALLLCRFFDTNLSYVTRGILFLALGAGFFLANYKLIKKREIPEP